MDKPMRKAEMREALCRALPLLDKCEKHPLYFCKCSREKHVDDAMSIIWPQIEEPRTRMSHMVDVLERVVSLPVKDMRCTFINYLSACEEQGDAP